MNLYTAMKELKPGIFIRFKGHDEEQKIKEVREGIRYHKFWNKYVVTVRDRLGKNGIVFLEEILEVINEKKINIEE